MELWFAAASALATSHTSSSIQHYNNNNQVMVRVSVGSRRALGFKFKNQSWLAKYWILWTDPTFKQFSPPLKSHVLWARFVRLSALFIIHYYSPNGSWRVLTLEHFLPKVHVISMQERNVQASALFITNKMKLRCKLTRLLRRCRKTGPSLTIRPIGSL